MPAVVQAKQATSYQLSLDVAPTPGNLLLVAINRQDSPGGFGSAAIAGQTQIGALIRAHSSFGGIGALYYRRILAGDGVGPWGHGITGGNCMCRLVEISGVESIAGPIGSAQLNDRMADAVINELTLTPSRRALIVAAFASRLQAASGVFTPNGETTSFLGQIFPGGAGHDPGFMTRGALAGTSGLATPGGTMSGSTQDGYNWGGVVAAFALPAVKGFAGEPGGGVW